MYAAQHLVVAKAAVAGAARRAGVEAPPWRLVYQSRSGSPATPWLEPDVNDALAELAADGTTDVVIVPIGFLSDHVEVIWDCGMPHVGSRAFEERTPDGRRLDWCAFQCPNGHQWARPGMQAVK